MTENIQNIQNILQYFSNIKCLTIHNIFKTYIVYCFKFENYILEVDLFEHELETDIFEYEIKLYYIEKDKFTSNSVYDIIKFEEVFENVSQETRKELIYFINVLSNPYRQILAP